MEFETRTETPSYRLIITRRMASEVLISTANSAWSLPSLGALQEGRLAGQLVTAARQNWGLDTCCLWASRFPMAYSGASFGRYAFMQTVGQNDEPLSGMSWIAPCDAVSNPAMCSVDQAALRTSAEELDRHSLNPENAPFARPGWIEALIGWLQQQIQPLGLRFTGKFEQLDASPTFSLIRFETTGTAVWFKATGPPDVRERPVSVALARLFPGLVPRIVGLHPTWNGWLSEEVAGTPLNQINDLSAWERAAGQLAEFQIASIGKTAELLDATVEDLRIGKLQELIDPFLSLVGDLMAAQQKPTPRPLVDAELETLAETLKESCALLGSSGLPDTLVQTDMNPGNILVSENGCVFLDWAEASVAHPFVTFEYLREHMTRNASHERSAREGLLRAYLRPWRSLYSDAELRHALEISPLVAAFVYAVQSGSWRSPEMCQDPQLRGHLRSLTRRMYREAIRVSQRSQLCAR